MTTNRTNPVRKVIDTSFTFHPLIMTLKKRSSEDRGTLPGYRLPMLTDQRFNLIDK